MCGISGYIDFNKKTAEDTLESMIAMLHHRGPDDRGVEHFSFPECLVGLSQARLSIIDLSAAGHQPMHYQQLSVVFNGEIYNFKEIKKELEELGHQFISQSDTEVILHAFSEWGVKCVKRFIGMFAIVLLDKEAEKVYYFRDRAGVKPFYYYWKDGLMLFSSELKAFHKHPQFKKIIDPAALKLYLDFGYIPSPYTIFQDCHKLMPGKYLSLDLHTKQIEIQSYWELHSFYKKEESAISFSEAKKELHQLLKSACEYRMIADVPVGIFLSGGYDSSAVTAILQSNRSSKIKTFTIGFKDGNNEAPHAKKIAQHLGTDHFEYYCTTKEAQEIIPELPFIYDEPFADSSAIPTFLVSKIARQEVTVALSADAGDEVFAGYNNYPLMMNYANRLNKIPDSMKAIAGKVMKLGSYLTPVSKLSLKHKLYGAGFAIKKDKNQQIADLLWKASTLPNEYVDNLLIQANTTYSTGYQTDTSLHRDELSVMLAIDYDMYLQNDILTKVDRATMAVSLEGREPLLDHRLLEFAAGLPTAYKFDGVTGKKILKEIVHEYIPKEWMDRPKSGFSLPIYKWLNEELSYLLDEYLSEQAIAASNIFNPSFVNQLVQSFKGGNLHYKTLIWKLLMFQMWYKKWMA